MFGIISNKTIFRYLHTESSEDSLLRVQLGNVKANTELSYEFGVRKGSPLRTRLYSGTVQVPFQLQVDHVLPDGSHVMRVFTKWLPITDDKATAETSKVELS